MATIQELTTDEADLLISLSDYELERWLSTLPVHRQARVIRQLMDHRLPRERATDSLAEFTKQSWHVIEPVTPLDWGPHLDAMCLHLEAVADGRIKNLLITTPPGTTKSILVAVMLPAWIWATAPHERLLLASNDREVVLRDAVASRRLIESDWYRERWGHVYELTSDQNTKGWYENNRRGYRTSTTVGSTVTGKKGDLLILDDPHDAKKVQSEVDRQGVKDWWKAFYNRVNHPQHSRRIVVGQRLHVDDLQGQLAKSPEFVHLNLMEEFEPTRRCTTSIGWTDWRTEPGELLRPDRFGPAQIEQAKLTLGIHGYQAQHQQNPLIVEGAEFPIDWFGPSIWFDQWPSDPICRVMAIDPSKGKEAKSGDYSAIVWGVVDSQGTLWIDATLERFNVKILAETAIEHFERFRTDGVGIEVNQFQELLADQMDTLAKQRALMLPIKPLTNTVNKQVRIRRLTPFLGRGEIRFKAGSPGTARLVEQLQQFPLGTHDDGPDALEMLLRVAIELVNGRAAEVEQPDSVYS